MIGQVYTHTHPAMLQKYLLLPPALITEKQNSSHHVI